MKGLENAERHVAAYAGQTAEEALQLANKIMQERTVVAVV